jgi:hypothetical protein
MVEGELEFLLLARHPEEIVRRLELAVADDREFAPELEAEGVIERPAPLGIGDPVCGVQVARDARILKT